MSLNDSLNLKIFKVQGNVGEVNPNIVLPSEGCRVWVWIQESECSTMLQGLKLNYLRTTISSHIVHGSGP